MTAGIDEAGRGCLAGPVYAAAVILPPDFPVALLDDSKKLKVSQREEAALRIKERCISPAGAWGIGTASHEEIDRLNILRASLLAMERAFGAMLEKLDAAVRAQLAEAIVDGLHVPAILLAENPHFVCRALPKADALIPGVMAASILAKTARDAEMRRLDAVYPGYGYAKHKAYATADHLAAIHRLPPSPIARRTFRKALPDP
jgi:ribonuclease HII